MYSKKKKGTYQIQYPNPQIRFSSNPIAYAKTTRLSKFCDRYGYFQRLSRSQVDQAHRKNPLNPSTSLPQANSHSIRFSSSICHPLLLNILLCATANKLILQARTSHPFSSLLPLLQPSIDSYFTTRSCKTQDVHYSH